VTDRQDDFACRSPSLYAKGAVFDSRFGAWLKGAAVAFASFLSHGGNSPHSRKPFNPQPLFIT
jgi:hypothetical protein